VSPSAVPQMPGLAWRGKFKIVGAWMGACAAADDFLGFATLGTNIIAPR
jgi:hypothetical protein